MVEVDLHLAKAGPAEPSESLKVSVLVFLGRVEESVLRRAAVPVAELLEEVRLQIGPDLHAAVGYQGSRVRPFWLEMVGNTEQDVDRLTDWRWLPARGVEQIVKETTVHTPSPETQPTDQPRNRQCPES